ncbi:hypothetical protein [Actinotalea sp. JY-7876]|uniref:hypothetical protein n=1 Tax=Actinotalea sp. JY-7876 TaxID=2758442 RepID=UPI0015F6D767|nr:hypothetical protein [Actinotalea sp. JY-7876]
MSSGWSAATRRERWAGRRPDAATALTLAALALLAGIATLLARTGTLLVHACLPGDGLVGALGVRLALIGPDGECPEGTLGLAGDGAARLVLLVALPVVLAYVAAVLGGLSVVVVVRAARRALGACVASLAALRPRLPAAPQLLVRPVAAPAAHRVLALAPQVLGALVRRRGPPVLATA